MSETRIPRNKRADKKICSNLKRILTDSGLVRFNKSTNTFTAYWSELSHAGCHIASMAVLLNPKTNREVRFDLVMVQRDNEGDWQSNTYKSKDFTPELTLVVFND